MKISTGCDLIHIPNITNTIQDPKQLAKILNPGDTTNNTTEHIAGRIALKEAAIKALGLTADDWLQISIKTQPSGKPLIELAEPAKELVSIDGSLSHHKNYVIAFVVALYKNT